jgi:hypothetical protein
MQGHTRFQQDKILGTKGLDIKLLIRKEIRPGKMPGLLPSISTLAIGLRLIGAFRDFIFAVQVSLFESFTLARRSLQGLTAFATDEQRCVIEDGSAL